MRKFLFTIASLTLVSIYSFGQVMNNEYVNRKSNEVFDSLHIKAKAIVTIRQDGKRGLIIRTGADEKYIKDTLALYIYEGVIADSSQFYECINILPYELNKAPQFITYLMNNPLFLNIKRRR